MARHRNIRGLNYEEEYNDVYDEYSRSVEEESCISPRTARQYLYGDDDALKESLEKVEEAEDEAENDGDADGEDLSLIDAKTYSCLEAIQDVVGETIPEDVIVKAIRKCKYDSEKALDMLLNRNNTTKTTFSPATTPKLPQGLAQKRSQQQQKQFPSNEERLPSLPSNLYLALATTQHQKVSKESAVVDFEVYNFRKFMRDFFMKTLVHYERAQREKAKPSSAAVANAKLKTPVRNNSKGDLTKLNNTTESKSSSNRKSTNNVLDPSKLSTAEITTTSSASSSPFSTPKLAKSTKAAKPAAEIEELYKRKRGGDGQQQLNLNLVIVGHVDAGKSTIMGHLLALLGEVSKKSMHKNEVDAKKAGKSSFMFAWVLDETEEERSRGITIDVGQHRFATEKRAVTILDAPGHRDFIPNMIAGATKADVAILVVDATKGEFETGFESGGQTPEHTLLLRSLGISQLAVVVNKLDNVAFSEDRYLEIVDKLRKFLKQVGFKEGNVHFVPCSGLTGDNLVHASKEAAFAWYKGGPTLVQIIDGFTPNERPVTRPFRMSINDIFKGQTSGICVAGKIDSGFIETGQKLLIRPANEVCTVKNILKDDEPTSEAFAGDVLTLNLTLPEGTELSVGSVLCDLYSPPCTMATKFEARIFIFAHIETPITKGASVLLYSVCLNSEVARISKLTSLVDQRSQAVLKRNPRLLLKNNSAIVEFTSARPVVVEAYAEFKEYGRFIFRAGNQSIGAGIVTKIIA